MASQEYTGLALDTNMIHTARLVKASGILELIEVETLQLPGPLDELGKTTPSADQGIPSELEADNVFGLDEPDDTPEELDLDNDLLALETDTEPDPGGDETEDDNESFDRILAAYWSRLESRLLQIGINIPLGTTLLQPLEKVQPAKMKKKERLLFFENKLTIAHNQDLKNILYAWHVDESENGWLASCDSEPSFLNYIDRTLTSIPKTVRIRDMLPDEAILAGMATSHYELPDEETTCLVIIGLSTSRLLFLKGNRLINIMPVVNEDAGSSNILQTLFSKLLFEIDKGTLQTLDRLIIMQSPVMSHDPLTFFQQQLDDVDIRYFMPDKNILKVPDQYYEEPVKLQPYVAAIGAAQAASGHETTHWQTLSLLPSYIKERQQIFKLSWHGILLLIMIALAPLLINKWYQDSLSTREELQQSINLKNIQIAELLPLSQKVEELMTEYDHVKRNNDRITELSSHSYLWSDILAHLNSGISEINHTWLASLRVTGDHLHLTGFTLSREAIPMVTALFDNADVLQVTENQVRGRTVYSFSIQVNNFRNEKTSFSPTLPAPVNKSAESY